MSEIININNTKLSKDELNDLLVSNGFKLAKIRNKPNITDFNITDFNIISYDNINNSIITFKNKDDDIIFTIDFKNKKLLTYKNNNANTKYIKLLTNFNIIKEPWLIKFIDVLKDLCDKNYGISLLVNNENYFRLIEFLCKKDFNFSFRYSRSTYGISEEKVISIISYLQQFKKYKTLSLSYGKDGISLNDYYFQYSNEEAISFHKRLEQFVNFNSELDMKIFFAFCSEFSEHFLKHKNHKLLFDYVKYSFINQGLDINYSTLRLYRDYLSMSKKLYGNDFDWYPKYLKTQHDIVQQNLRVQSSEAKNTKYLSIKEKNTNLIFSDKQYSVVLPQDIDDIIKEGKDLNHCLASYIDDYILSEDSFVVFMRATNNVDKRLVTLQIKDNKIIQQKGFSNRDPNDEELIFIDKYQKYLDKLTEEGVINDK